MNERLTVTRQQLAEMGSEQAATWLIATYPTTHPQWADALELIAHLSWRRPDQSRLARHYLAGLPFAVARPYEVFAHIMALDSLLEVLRELTPGDQPKRELLRYHLAPALKRAAQTQSQRDQIEAFLTALQ